MTQAHLDAIRYLDRTGCQWDALPADFPHPNWSTFSWINRCRRTVRDYERLPQHHAAMIQWSMIIIMTRRLARHQHTCNP